MKYNLTAIRIAWRDWTDDPATKRNLETHTSCELEEKIQQRVEQYRVQIHAGRACGKNTAWLLEYSEKQSYTDLRTFANYVAGERAQRAGKARAINMIKEANEFSENFLRTLAPSLYGADDSD